MQKLCRETYLGDKFAVILSHMNAYQKLISVQENFNDLVHWMIVYMFLCVFIYIHTHTLQWRYT